MIDNYTTISVKKSTWKKLSVLKIRGDYVSFDDLFGDLAIAKERKALKQNK
jgi:hypothetical protein